MAEKLFDVSHEVERKTRQLSVVLGVFGAVVLIALGVAIVLSLPREVLAVQSGLLLCVGLSYYLLRQGRVRAAVVLFLLSWLAFPLGSLASSSADMMLFMMPYLLIPTIVVAGMLLSPGGAFVALVALTLGYLGAIVARGGWREIGSVWASGVAGAAPVGLFYLLLPLLSGVMLAALSWLSGRGMNGALEQTAQSARVARAQLDASISMVADLVVASARVAGLADELTTTMGYIRTGTEEIAEATGRVAVGAGDQAREVERISESSAQLAEATRRIASDTHETSIAAAESERLIEATATMIETLRRRLKAVDGVARLVDKLADQTNLLALNASIEAARAGAAGAGFAVVAEEMQDLAARSAVSVRDIGTATQEVHRSLTPVLASVVEVQDEARRSQQLSEQVAVMTVQQEQSSDAMVVAVGEIAVVAEQNAVATERIAASVEEQLASIEQLVEATQRLSEIAGDLRTIVAGQLNQGDGQGLRARLCPNFADSPILEELCYEEASGALIRQYCMGDFDVCARKQFRDAKKPVPSGLWPDGTIAEER